MTPQDPEILRDRGRSLENEFFRREDQRLIARLAELKAAVANREALAKASGISNPAVLDKLLELGIRAETVAALSLVPLVEVAWADGKLDPKERQAILDHLPNAGIAAGSTAHGLLQAWLERPPDRKLLDAWTQLVKGISAQVTPDEAAPPAGASSAWARRSRAPRPRSWPSSSPPSPRRADRAVLLPF
ncbi:MAG: hypothetical protein DMD78_09185 [Candidatus Rokuibacteriota bacterium]|nr:MAG: hypothetical protein DMD78_09185 [Candidatus Rokubacteria bacterium]